MTILYYVPHLSQANGGIRQYACAMLEALANDREHTYVVVHNGQDAVMMDIIRRNPHLIHIPPSTGHERWYERLITDGAKLTNQILRSRKAKRSVQIRSYVDRLCNRYNIDVVHCPYQHAPHTATPVIATMHDVQEIHMPELFSPTERAERAVIFMGVTERAAQIVVSFEHIRQDMIKYFNRTPESVSVCPLNLQTMWFDEFKDADVLTRQSLDLPESYCLYPAATWPHKNHQTLLEAIAIIREKYSKRINLICTGHKNAHYETLHKLSQALSIDSQVQFRGVVDERTLFSLYKHARAVAIPTLYEAGSYPLFESMFLGVPVVCSSVTSLPDTIGDQDYLFDPRDKCQMADRLNRIMTDELYRSQNLKICQSRTHQLRSQTPLQAIKEVYRKCVLLPA